MLLRVTQIISKWFSGVGRANPALSQKDVVSLALRMVRFERLGTTQEHQQLVTTFLEPHTAFLHVP